MFLDSVEVMHPFSMEHPMILVPKGRDNVLSKTCFTVVKPVQIP